MICTIVFTYTLVLLNRQTFNRVKYLDEATYQLLVLRASDKKFMKESGFKELAHQKMQRHAPFDCATLKPMKE